MDYENLTPQYRIEEYLEAIVEGWVDATVASYPDYPSWRLEEFLDAFITYIWEDGDHPRHPCPEPVWRLEECLRAIYDVMTGAATPWAFPTPTNRIEEYLAAIHAYLADGTELAVPEPVWRIEQWLAYALDAVKQSGDVTKTVSGTMVHITDALAKAALSVLASIEPIQDLHGYENPWPAGGGKNKFDYQIATQVKNEEGITFTINDDGSVTMNGTATNRSQIYWRMPADVTRQFSGMLLDCFQEAITGVASLLEQAGGAYTSYAVQPFGTNTPITIASSIEGNDANLIIRIQAGTTLNNKRVYPMIRPADSQSGYAPYSNICPISGRTGLSVYVSPTTAQADATTYAVDWTSQAGTVYGGTVDVVTGVLTVDTVCATKALSAFALVETKTNTKRYRYLDNFFGSSLPLDSESGNLCNIAPNAYNTSDSVHFYPVTSTGRIEIWVPTDLPTSTEVQIAVPIATPLTYQLSAQEVQMLLGENYVWSSSGDTVSVTYYAEGNANPLQSLNILLGGRYSNPKTADDVSDREALEIILGGNK